MLLMPIAREASALLTLAAHVDFGASLADYSLQAGLVSLVLTFVGNGTHSTFAKLAGPAASPLVYSLYLACGLCVACTIVVLVLGEPLETSGPGLLAGVLLSASVSCYISSIVLVGMIWCDMLTASSATLVSFLWGKLFFREASVHLAFAGLGVACLLGGIAGISWVLSGRLEELEQERTPDGPQATLRNPRSRALGLLLAACAGSLGGTSFPVSKMQPADARGVSFVWAQALGMFATQALLTAAAAGWDLARQSWSDGEEGTPLVEGGRLASGQGQASKHDAELPAASQAAVLGRWELRRLAPLALAQGAVLAVANAATTVAALSPVGIGVAQPVREAGHCVGVLIGALGFREFGEPSGRFLGGLLFFTAVDILGIVLVVYFGSAPS